MKRRPFLALSVAGWIAVGLFWFMTTRAYHPRLSLAVFVTAALITAYAIAAYINHLVLIPRYRRGKHFSRYAIALLSVMVVLTGIALTVIRASYFAAIGPDPDPHGFVRHFAIDFAGMAVHLTGAAIAVWVFGKVVVPHQE